MNEFANIAGVREIGCPECYLEYRQMKLDKGGVPIARFTGEGNIRTLEIEATDALLSELSTTGGYMVHAIVREPQMAFDFGDEG